ncbi:hypothetical protein V8F20_009199 [Naviculisporaceae sp. PSN 640]
MGKKKRGHPDLEELLARPWCYYCEREFEDLKLLISHQKAKHFKCERCGKRLNTAGGMLPGISSFSLTVHMNQVHKESLTSVENALPNRQGLDVEIFGMEGVPEDILQQHNQRIIQTYYQDQADRRAATGNPPPGQSGNQGPSKKIKMETKEELKARLAEWRARKANGTAPAVPADSQSPAQVASPFPPPQPGFPYPAIPGAPVAVPAYPGVPAYPPAFPAGPSPPPGAAGAFNLPARPPSGTPPATALPQRPSYPYNGAGVPPAFPGATSTVDELVSSGARQGDDIDQLIRMAEAGIKPAKGAEEGATDKKAKKDKTRMFYNDSEVSPEEKMAMLPRYRFTPTAA